MEPTLILQVMGALHGARLSDCCEVLSIEMGDLRHGSASAYHSENIEVWFHIDEPTIYELGKRMGRLENLQSDVSPELVDRWKELILHVKDEQIIRAVELDKWKAINGKV